MLAYFDNLERELLFILRASVPPVIAECPDVDPGLEKDLEARWTDEFLDTVDTKRYTNARLRRILLNMYIGTKASDLMIMPPYGRVLAFNEKGTEILKAAKETGAIVTSEEHSIIGGLGSAVCEAVCGAYVPQYPYRVRM